MLFGLPLYPSFHYLMCLSNSSVLSRRFSLRQRIILYNLFFLYVPLCYFVRAFTLPAQSVTWKSDTWNSYRGCDVREGWKGPRQEIEEHPAISVCGDRKACHVFFASCPASELRSHHQQSLPVSVVFPLSFSASSYVMSPLLVWLCCVLCCGAVNEVPQRIYPLVSRCVS